MIFDLIDELVADDPAKRLEIEFAPHRKGSRQIVVADIGLSEALEGRVAEDVIGMFVRVDDIEDRLVRAGADRRQQSPADRHAAARIDDGHAVVADHETDVGDVAEVLFAHERDFALMDEDARRDFLHRQGGRTAPQNAPCGENARMATRRAPMSQRMFQFCISSRPQIYRVFGTGVELPTSDT